MKLLLLKVVLCVLRFIAFFRPKKRFRPGGVDYLDRWYYTPTGKGRFAKWWRKHLPGVFLHCFLASDPDRGWHSHPWTWGFSWIVDGRYRESRPRDWLYGDFSHCWRTFTPGMVNILTGADWHQVKLETERVWTLFVVGPLHGLEWSFMDETGKITPHGTDTPGD